jgi:segregation and condensation protein A
MVEAEKNQSDTAGPKPDFEDDGGAPVTGGFVVELEGFEGPLDLLLTLARQQKVDIRQISILRLAEQFLEFIAEARRIRLELAADYLVMAAWLAYLKSRLLLPEAEGDDEPTGEELAARLQHQLHRLEAMREVADELMRRDRLGQDVFARGAPEGVRIIRDSIYECSLYELLGAYGARIGSTNSTTFTLRPMDVMSIDEALSRLTRLLGDLPDWASLETFLPADLASGFQRRSAIASTFAACLELAKQGRLLLRQGQSNGPIFMKGREPRNEPEEQA